MERSKIQVLYDACHALFSQERLPTFQQIHYLKNLLDKIEAIDVGIDEFGLCDSSKLDSNICGSRCLLNGQGFSEVTYIHIHECDSFSIGIFCLPAGKVFPLHDHPGMTVLSKLLYGSVYVKAYDWIKMDDAGCQTKGLAGRVIDEVFKAPHESSILFPRSGGNIHSFTALTPCAILDVLSPPYSEEFGRPSTYFSDFPIPFLSGYAMLEEKPMPNDLIVHGAPYLGPSVVTVYDYDYCQIGFENHRITISEIRNHPWFLRNLPIELMEGGRWESNDINNPSQNVEEVLFILQEARKPLDIPKFGALLTVGSIDLDDLDADVDLEDIETSGDFVCPPL